MEAAVKQSNGARARQHSRNEGTREGVGGDGGWGRGCGGRGDDGDGGRVGDGLTVRGVRRWGDGGRFRFLGFRFRV